jgi:hypothetical protein
VYSIITPFSSYLYLSTPIVHIREDLPGGPLQVPGRRGRGGAGEGGSGQAAGRGCIKPTLCIL